MLCLTQSGLDVSESKKWHNQGCPSIAKTGEDSLVRTEYIYFKQAH